ncbi:MAG: hypothetical protein M1817_002712 [Caeruleum heppii]|nr:MAG: hypothetical protein M1817_002712 [Caeruleum heppii]
MPATLLPAETDAFHHRPAVKRLKLSNGTSSSPHSSSPASRIFTPYRTIGLVSSTSVPFTSVPLGKSTFQVTTTIGRSLHTYDLRTGLNLVFLSRPETPASITATAAWKDRVFAAWGNPHDGVSSVSSQGIWVFKRGKKTDELECPSGLAEPVQQLLVFGSWIVACCHTRIEVWQSTSYEHYTTLFPPSSGHGSDVLAGKVCNMPTYLNKIFSARMDGKLEIWNLSTGKLVYTILPPSPAAGPITALQPAPALSLLAVAYQAGPLIIHDVQTDISVISLRSNSSREGPITSISFRTDGRGAGDEGRNPGMMATSGPASGDITFWTLQDGGRVMGILRGAHCPASKESAVRGGVNKVEFLSGQPVIVTGGLDNSLKSWIFDETPYSPIPRVLHSRSGHAAPVTRLLFLPTDADGADAGGKWILTAGRDRSLWGWSLRRDGQSTELSQGNIRKRAKKLGLLGDAPSGSQPASSIEDLKVPAITCMALSLNRDGGMSASGGKSAAWSNIREPDGKKGKKAASASNVTGWESIVTGHEHDKTARTWFWGRRRAGRWAFDTSDGGHVQSVAITPCGTFALIGSSLGIIDMFNLQSGIHRQRFPPKVTPAQARGLAASSSITREMTEFEAASQGFRRGEGRHTKAVTGLMVDSVNRTVISCSLDGLIKFWDFATGRLAGQIDWSLTSAILDLRHHQSNDLAALSCNDSAIRVIDITTKNLVRELWAGSDHINDFCFSNDGRWIIAASMDSNIRIWDLPTGHLIDAIRLQRPCMTMAFSSTGEFLATALQGELGINVWSNRSLFTHIPTRHLTEGDVSNLQISGLTCEANQNLIEAAFEDTEKPIEQTQDTLTTLDRLSEDIMTLSLVPKARWQTLLNLDVIKQRNRPKEPPKAPQKAPFFLPSLQGGRSMISQINEAEKRSDPTEESRILKLSSNGLQTTFTRLLGEGRVSGNYDAFVEHLKTLSPSQADLQIRSLDTPEEMMSFVSALSSRLRQKMDYELVHAWMAVFLRLHSDAQDTELLSALEDWRSEQRREAQRLTQLTSYCSGVIGFLRAPR